MSFASSPIQLLTPSSFNIKNTNNDQKSGDKNIQSDTKVTYPQLQLQHPLKKQNSLPSTSSSSSKSLKSTSDNENNNKNGVNNSKSKSFVKEEVTTTKDIIFFNRSDSISVGKEFFKLFKIYTDLGVLSYSLKPSSNAKEFERGEFCGDRYLEVILTQIIRKTIPNKEFSPCIGTTIIATAACNNTLSKMFDHFGIIGLMDPGELTLSSKKWKADVMECIISQLYDARIDQSIFELVILMIYHFFSYAIFMCDMDVKPLTDAEIKQLVIEEGGRFIESKKEEKTILSPLVHQTTKESFISKQIGKDFTTPPSSLSQLKEMNGSTTSPSPPSSSLEWNNLVNGLLTPYSITSKIV